MKILKGHTSPETAYVQESYPYGFGQRCKKRYWVEHREGFGYRLGTQTSIPPKNSAWNQAHYSRYSSRMVLYLDDNKHVQAAREDHTGMLDERVRA